MLFPLLFHLLYYIIKSVLCINELLIQERLLHTTIDFILFGIYYAKIISVQFKFNLCLVFCLYINFLNTNFLYFYIGQNVNYYVCNQLIFFIHFLEFFNYYYTNNRCQCYCCCDRKRNIRSMIEVSKFLLSNDECIICLNHIELKNNYKIKNCKCAYTYHKNCIHEWLIIEQTCPICRIEL